MNAHLQPEPVMGAPDPNADVEIVSTTLVKFNAVATGLAALAAKYKGVVYPVQTAQGLADAKAARAALREPRYEVDRLRKAAKAPLIALGKKIQETADAITEEILELENPIHAQVRAEEARKEAERAAKAEAERKRVALIQEHIDDIRGLLAKAAGKDAKAIQLLIEDARDAGINERLFQEFVGTAEDVRVKVVNQLTSLLQERQIFEAEQLRQAEERVELERQRIAQEARQAEIDAQAKRLAEEQRAAQEAEEQRLSVERERLAAERRASQEEADRRQREHDAAVAEAMAQIKAEREESERLEAERKARLDAEEIRLADERAAFEHEQAAAREAPQPPTALVDQIPTETSAEVSESAGAVPSYQHIRVESRFVKIDHHGDRQTEDCVEWAAVEDMSTGLIWTRDDIGTDRSNWTRACEAAASVKLCGFHNWRLPTIKELLTLVDYERHNPAINKAYFPSCKADWYWTSTPAASSPGDYAWSVHFSGGDAYCGLQYYEGLVRAVRPPVSN